MTTTQFYLKSCTKDNGDLILLEDRFGPHLSCMQCGQLYDLQESNSKKGYLNGNCQPNGNLAEVVKGPSNNSSGNEIFDKLVKVANTIDTNYNPILDVDIQLQTHIPMSDIYQSLDILNSGMYITKKGSKKLGMTYETDAEQSSNIQEITKEYSKAIKDFLVQIKNDIDSKNEGLFDSEGDITEFGQYVSENLSGSYTKLKELIQIASNINDSNRKN